MFIVIDKSVECSAYLCKYSKLLDAEKREKLSDRNKESEFQFAQD